MSISSLTAIGTPSSGPSSPAARRRSASSASVSARSAWTAPNALSCGIERLDPGKREFDQLARRGVASPHELDLACDPCECSLGVEHRGNLLRLSVPRHAPRRGGPLVLAGVVDDAIDARPRPRTRRRAVEAAGVALADALVRAGGVALAHELVVGETSLVQARTGLVRLRLGPLDLGLLRRDRSPAARPRPRAGRAPRLRRGDARPPGRGGAPARARAAPRHAGRACAAGRQPAAPARRARRRRSR